jgi:hypothetical protein
VRKKVVVIFGQKKLSLSGMCQGESKLEKRASPRASVTQAGTALC